MAKNIKKWYQSKTIRIALIQAIAGLLAVFASEYPELGVIAVIKSFVDILLRFTTEEKIK